MHMIYNLQEKLLVEILLLDDSSSIELKNIQVKLVIKHDDNK